MFECLYQCALALFGASSRSKVKGVMQWGSVGKDLNPHRTSVTGSHDCPDIRSMNFPWLSVCTSMAVLPSWFFFLLKCQREQQSGFHLDLAESNHLVPWIYKSWKKHSAIIQWGHINVKFHDFHFPKSQFHDMPGIPWPAGTLSVVIALCGSGLQHYFSSNRIYIVRINKSRSEQSLHKKQYNLNMDEGFSVCTDETWYMLVVPKLLFAGLVFKSWCVNVAKLLCILTASNTIIMLH